MDIGNPEEVIEVDAPAEVEPIPKEAPAETTRPMKEEPVPV